MKNPDSIRSTALLWLLFSAIAFPIYGPSLSGPFLSDDYIYILTNPWTEQITPQSVASILDPVGEARFHYINYAPVHLLATALERFFFGDVTLGYHVVNVVLHALNAALLAWLLVASGLSFTAASIGGLLFVVHPANVEAVAWASQLKTNGAMALSLGALLALRSHPAWATLLFALALLTKATAFFALPFAAALIWASTARLPQESQANWRSRGPWMALWALLFGLFCWPQMTAFQAEGGTVVPAYEDFWVHLRTIASIGVHYLVMATTSLGLSHTHEHPAVLDSLDPWWLVSIPLGTILFWRMFSTLRRRSMEGAWWLSAAVSFGPVSQIFPFAHPIADRYLYFILPGLIGGILFALRDARNSLRHFAVSAPSPTTLVRVATATALVFAVFLATQASLRSRLWAEPLRLSLDSERNYPDGRTAAYLRAQRAARLGDADTAVTQLRRAVDLGRNRFDTLDSDPTLAPIRDDPGFRKLVDELTNGFIKRLLSQERELNQSDLTALFVAYFRLEQFEEAEQSLEAARERGGLMEENLALELQALRSMRQKLKVGGENPPQPTSHDLPHLK